MENTSLTSYIIPSIGPMIVLIVGFVLNWLRFKRKEKKDTEKVEAEIDKLIIERNKIKVETDKIKKAFQPIVLSTLMESQNFYRNDKINALKKLVDYKSELFYLEQYFEDGIPAIGELYDYDELIYEKIGEKEIRKFKHIKNEYGYLFLDNIVSKINGLHLDIENLKNIRDREISKNEDKMPNGAIKIMDKLEEKFDDLINSIRSDLNIDSNFINEFIEKYRILND